MTIIDGNGSIHDFNGRFSGHVGLSPTARA